MQNPPNSPGLSALDFHLWGDMEKKVHLITPKSLAALKAAVCKVWSEIDMGDVGRATRASWPARLKKCSEANGGMFERAL